MDADFSHDPAHLPAMVEAARDADLVLGSRYVAGRRGAQLGPRCGGCVSRGGCWYARVVLGVDVRDLTGRLQGASGARCWRRSTCDRCRSQGYAFQVELTYRAIQAGFRVREVPIVFTDRRVGQSKMSRRIVLEAMWMVPRLRAGRGRYTK